MIKAILYDLDGVLVEAVEIHFDALNMALKEVSNFEVTKAEEEDFNGLPTKEKLKKLTAQGRVREEDHQLIWQRKQDLTKDVIRKKLTLDKLKEELHEYTRNLRIRSVCVTNSITETAKLMLECSGQWPYMEFLISNQMVSNPKPHGEGYIRAMVSLGVYPDECVIVEDSIVGIMAAKSTGAYVFEVENSKQVTKENLEQYIKNIQ